MPLGSALVVAAVVLTAAPRPSADGSENVVLYVGTQQVVTARCQLQRLAVDATPTSGLQRLAIGDASIADIKILGGGQVLVIGAAVGRTTVLGWCSDGRRVSWLITVLPGAPPKPDLQVKVKQRQVDAMVVDETGARSAQVTIVEFPGELHDVSEVVSADGGVSFVGYDSAGLRVSITATPYRPRSRGRADAGLAADAGVRRDDG